MSGEGLVRAGLTFTAADDKGRREDGAGNAENCGRLESRGQSINKSIGHINMASSSV